MKAFELKEKKTQELNTKLTKAEWYKRSAETALNGAERQVEVQRKQLRQAKNKLSTAKNQIKVLTKKLEAKKAKDQAEQDEYEARVAETEEALRTEVSKVYRYYYLQVWNKALNQVRVKASFSLKRAESVYYPLAICVSSSFDLKADTASKEADISMENPAKVLPSSVSPSKEVEQPEVFGKETSTIGEVA